jgi:DNA-binding Lrp family transcriptional regulator
MKQIPIIEKLLAKLRQPISLDYISQNILGLSEFETLEILNELVEDDIIEKNGKYYEIKKKNNI